MKKEERREWREKREESGGRREGRKEEEAGISFSRERGLLFFWHGGHYCDAIFPYPSSLTQSTACSGSSSITSSTNITVSSYGSYADCLWNILAPSGTHVQFTLLSNGIATTTSACVWEVGQRKRMRGRGGGREKEGERVCGGVCLCCPRSLSKVEMEVLIPLPPTPPTSPPLS